MKKLIIAIIVILVLVALVIGGIFIIRNREKTPSIKVETAQDMEELINSIYSNVQVKLPSLMSSVIDKNDDMLISAYTGLQSKENVEELVISEPLMNAQAYSLALVKVSDSADVEAMKQEMLNNINMRKWICVSAEKLYITNSGNLIFLVMSNEEWAKSVYDEFKNIAGGNVGKELEKSENLDTELPPEIL